jgi:uncharacterized protein Yka (UPF0111/DUF47 family)
MVLIGETCKKLMECVLEVAKVVKKSNEIKQEVQKEESKGDLENTGKDVITEEVKGNNLIKIQLEHTG